jgi:DNA/RNA-binding domain of Phe-tRNA-synthetase-like protein
MRPKHTSDVEFNIDKRLFSVFPEFSAYALSIAIHIESAHATAIVDAAIGHAGSRASVPVIDEIRDHPHVAQWREAYRRMDVKSKYRSSIEALLRRAAKGDGIRTGLRFVDLYNGVSLSCGAPIGAYDADRL